MRKSLAVAVIAIYCFEFLSIVVNGLNVLIPGGTGPLGQALASKLSDHDVTILARNAFLAAAPARVTNDFGWVGLSFLQRHPYVKLRDWDGGDLLDIVGCDWMGWQEDSLNGADVVVHLVGGFTEQRVMACERIVRESLRYNRKALHITVNPIEDQLDILSPGMKSMKQERINRCESMVLSNCLNQKCLRLEVNQIEEGCQIIAKSINELKEALA